MKMHKTCIDDDPARAIEIRGPAFDALGHDTAHLGAPVTQRFAMPDYVGVRRKSVCIRHGKVL